MSTVLERLARLARRAGGATAPRLTTKAAAIPSFALYAEGRASWTPRDPAALARAGYQRNPVVHRAVRLVAASAASLPLIATGPGAGGTDELLALLARPNPRESGTRLLETLYADLLLTGTAYLEAVRLDGRVTALQALRPGRIRMLPGPAAGRPPTSTRRAGAAAGSTCPRPGPARWRRSWPSPCSTRRTIPAAWRPSRRRRRPSTSTTSRAPGKGPPRQRRAPLRRPGLRRGGALRAAIRPAEGGAGGE